MKIELKKLKTHPRLSEETLAFSAELWIDGKKAADASNDGKGGSNRVYFVSKVLHAAFSAFVKTLPPSPSEIGPLEVDEDFFVSLLVEKAEFENRLNRLSKSKVLFSVPGDKDGDYRSVKFNVGDKAGAVKYVLAKYSNAVIYGS